MLLPVYNGLPHVVDTIESLQRQSHATYQAFVLDDASSDGSADRVAPVVDERFRLIRCEQNLGMPGNWNRALDLVETPYFVLGHQDDLYEPDFLATMVGLIARHPNAFIAHCKVEPIDAAGRPVFVAAERYKESLWPRDDPYERAPREGLSALAVGNYIVMPTVIYRTAAVRTIGHFAPHYRFVADWQYWVRGLLAGFTVVGTHRRLVKRRWHRGMATHRAELDDTRYGEEIALTRWIAERAHEHGFRTTPAANYSTVMNLVLRDFGARLAAGRSDEARKLLALAKREIPGFRRSTRDVLAETMSRLGRLGGLWLTIAANAYVRGVTSALPRTPWRRGRR